MALRVGYKQIQVAREVNFIDFLEAQYPNQIKFNQKTKEYIHPEHDSMKFYDKGYFRFSTNTGGDSIRFLTDFLGLSFVDAVLQLCAFNDGFEVDYITPRKPKSTQQNAEPVIQKTKNEDMPTKATRNIELLTYLINERGIDRETVDMLLQQGVIYQDVKQNIVFVNESKDFALLRGTKSDWKNVWKSGNGYWCFSVGDKPQDVFICEAPIDAISLYLLRGKAPGVYIALGGVKHNTVAYVIQDYPEHKIRIAPDWDDAGFKFVEECRKRYKGLIHLNPKAERLEAAGICKDWNELLIAETKLNSEKS